MQTIFSDLHARHHPGLEFYEGELKHYHDTPNRAQIVLDALRSAGCAAPSAPQDFGLDPILAVHRADYVTYLQRAYADWVGDGGIPAGVFPDVFPMRSAMRHGGRILRPTKPSALAGYYSFDLTAIIVEGTWEAVYHSAQCALTAARIVHAGAPAAFALCRPPGHHAHADLCGGYCFLNNASIASHWLASSTSTAKEGQTRVALLDIDFHHGNGSQDIFYSRDDVLFVSLHGDPSRQYPYFIGAADECGEGPGYGYTVNFPLEQGVGDERYLDVLAQACERVARYAPSYLVISLGVDTYQFDPLGDFALTSAIYPRIGALIAQLGLPTVFIMEGGYAIEQLGLNVAGVLSGFEEVRPS
ncbi:MAG: histone deacetylase family protein [Chloroflexi bacterium]|nr:histone deacetylase family protein [Chloroflexota bacterium]